jgi:hypothetical protein
MFEAPELYSVPARICLGIAICGGALLVAITGLYLSS